MCFLYRAELPGYVWDVYHRSFSMSTYLVSIAVLDSPSWVSTHFEGIVLNIWARPSLLNQTRQGSCIPLSLLYLRAKWWFRFVENKASNVYLNMFTFLFSYKGIR